MKAKCMLTVLVTFSIGAIGSAAAADIGAGKIKAGPCAVCHGGNGEGKGNNPPIAGWAPARFVQAINDYKSGKRPSTIMKGYAAKLDDSDTAHLAAYYASLKK